MQSDGTARQVLRDWIKRQIFGAEEVAVAVLSKRAIAEFGADEQFVGLLVRELLPSMIAQEARFIMAQSRGFVPYGGKFVAKEKIQAILVRHIQGDTTSVWHKWFEHVGDKHVALPSMTRVQLLIAADEREQRGLRSLSLAKFFRQLAELMSDHETVRDHFTDDELAHHLSAFDTAALKEVQA